MNINDQQKDISWWQPVLFAALAGAMAWGIRGQYGHETGAMIAGLLVSLTLVLLLCPNASKLNVARAVALCTIAMGFGGSMTYGQTVGLTHDAPLVGNWAALRWGMIGLSIKGAAWIGFAGVFLGMGLSGIRYRCREMLLIMLSLVGLYFLGVYLINSPYNPSEKLLPALYFSDHWHWEPETYGRPRFECWGGLHLALISLIAYVGLCRKDRLAPRLAFWAILGGAIGFPLGQSLQAYHVWNLASFREGMWAQLDPYMNWWNMMETTFGAVMGGMLGLGLWLNRKRILLRNEPDKISMPFAVEWILIAVHLSLIFAVEFKSIRVVDALYDLGLIMGIIPMVAIVGGRWWPFMMIFPVTLFPIAGKTIRQLVYRESSINPTMGWIIYGIIPLIIVTSVAFWFARQATTKHNGYHFTRIGLLLSTWIYFLLNYAFFHFNWPWAEWTGRTPNGIIFTVCAVGLTFAALIGGRRETILNQ